MAPQTGRNGFAWELEGLRSLLNRGAPITTMRVGGFGFLKGVGGWDLKPALSKVDPMAPR